MVGHVNNSGNYDAQSASPDSKGAWVGADIARRIELIGKRQQPDFAAGDLPGLVEASAL